MGAAQRILKNLGAMLLGRLISILQQIVVPAVFVYHYRLLGFGEWGALSSTVAALSTLNFGVQTYMNQDLAIRFTRGETEGYHVRQSTALRVLCGAILVVAVLLLGIFAIPFDKLLKLDISRSNAQWTLYLLALQVLLMVLFGYFGGIFMGVNKAWRGANWNNVQALLSACGLLVGVILHEPFPVLAAIQLSTLVICVAGVLIDLRRVAPQIFPNLNHWDKSLLKEILSGSGYFGMLEISNFFIYQAPLLLLQRFVGGAAVGSFILMRTIFSMCRQILSMFTQSMGAEITNLFGHRDWPTLTRLYNYSERLIFFLISLVNVTVLMLSPVLITLWIHRKTIPGTEVSRLFSIYPYVLASAISIVISIKEHKTQFQFSTNTHVDLARMIFFGYVVMDMIACVTIQYAGVVGFLWTWLAFEIFQTSYLIVLNGRLFHHVQKLDLIYISRLTLLCGVSLVAAAAGLRYTSELLLWQQGLLSFAVAGVVGGLSWQIFHIAPVFAGVMGRVSKRFA
jgi:O-antigen/teichoic acid export membrane protein